MGSAVPRPHPRRTLIEPALVKIADSQWLADVVDRRDRGAADLAGRKNEKCIYSI